MAEPSPATPRAPDAPPGPTAEGAPAPGLELLGWSPTWRDRLDAVVAAGPAKVAGATVGGVLAVVLAVVLLRGPASPPPPELTLPLAGGPGDPSATSTTTTTSAPAAADVVVHAAGGVARPGLFRLPPGARVADLLDAAGGPALGADLDRLNLAAPLVDGERVYVPLVGQDVPLAVSGGGGAGTGPSADGAEEPLDLNSADLAALEALPGIGPATAQAILDERGRRGGFRSVEELLDVRGIGDAKLAALRDRVRV